ncbi:hypothetical protein ACFPT7_09135 [Acidicapsa dinghuensis]|uniref:Ribbon-helix-helix protein, CopG family n=1 Tax=Acidicapsa dinghuensis TaxID=2218256 RepID=A0ABW1EGU1_9BACT|nr:hypothetical protein [Acidicapsa dinghuensis]
MNRETKPDTVRTSIDLPRDLHRRVHEAAARTGCSARKLILEGIESVIREKGLPRPTQRLDLDANPPIPSEGRRLRLLTNDEIYELIELP